MPKPVVPPSGAGNFLRAGRNIFLGVVALTIIGFIMRAFQKDSSPFASTEISCVGQGVSSVSCSVKVTGLGRAKACWEFVAECSGAPHRAKGCSRNIENGSVETYTLELSPPVQLSDRCTSGRVENVVLQ